MLNNVHTLLFHSSNNLKVFCTEKHVRYM